MICRRACERNIKIIDKERVIKFIKLFLQRSVKNVPSPVFSVPFIDYGQYLIGHIHGRRKIVMNWGDVHLTEGAPATSNWASLPQ